MKVVISSLKHALGVFLTIFLALFAIVGAMGSIVGNGIANNHGNDPTQGGIIIKTPSSLFVSRSLAQHTLVSIGHAQPLPPGTRSLGALPKNTPLHLDVVLAPRHRSALNSFLSALYQPSSPKYHHFLKRGQFALEFGPSRSTILAVEHTVSSEGLDIGKLSANRLIIPLTTITANAEHAFHTSLNRFRLPSGRIAYANTTPARVPETIAPYITAIVGLSSVDLAKPLIVKSPAAKPKNNLSPHTVSRLKANVTTAPTPCSSATSAATQNGSYTANQLAQAYGFTTGAYANSRFGTGETIALYELAPYQTSDISTYDSCYGISPTIKNVSVDGAAVNGTTSGSMETTSDIEDIAGLAPDANITVYVGPNTGQGQIDTYNTIATADNAQVVSTSWGGCEPLNNSSIIKAENTIFEQMATQGQSMLAASGDSGSEDCWAGNTTPYLFGIFCSSSTNPTDCVAVGDQNSNTAGAYVLLQNGIPGTTATLSAAADLYGVVCPTSTTCYAVGDGANGEGFFVSDTNGSIGTSSAISSTSGLNDIACLPTSTTCYAVGYAGVLGATNIGTIVPVTNGTPGTPVTVSGTSWLLGIACPTSTTCYAVGDNNSGEAVVVPITNSTIGTPTVIPNLIQLDGIACPSSTTCYAVGLGDLNGTGIGAGVVITNGTVGTPGGVSGTSDLWGIACSSSTTCYTVGQYLQNTGSTIGVVVPITNSTIGTTVQVPQTINVEGIACVNSTICYGVGNTNNGMGVSVPITNAAVGNIQSNELLAVDDPASQPYVTGVGGTSLTAIGPPPTQSVWNNGNGTNGIKPGGGGGGISTFWQMPKWQTGTGVINQYSNSTSCGAPTGSYCREVPDVSASANSLHGYTIYEQNQGGWTSVGGTSLAAPLWASVIALTNEGCSSPTGFANPALYTHPSDLTDITSGNNDITGTNNGLYPATTGYDMASGLGSPTAAIFAPGALCPKVTTKPALSSISPTVGSTLGGTTVTLTGSGFLTTTNMTTVDFGSGQATSVTCSSSTSCTAVSPPGTGTVSVTVTTGGGTSNGENFTYIAPTGYTPLSPYRICDTRAANSTTILKNQCDTGGASPIGASGDISVAVAGYQSPYLAPNETPVPKGATAVVLNVTAVGASTPSYLSVCPGGEAISSCKASSNLNFVTGENIPNLVQVGLPTSGSAAGDIEVYNFSGSVNVVIDVEGYIAQVSTEGEGSFNSLSSPYRICDTRAANSTTILKNQCDTGGASPIGASGDISVAVAGYQSPYLAPNETPVPKGATAVVLNVTAVGASTPSYLSVCPGGEAISSCKASSNLNFVTGENIPNLVQVGLPTSGSAAGDIEVYNFSGSVNVVIDVEGWFSGSGATTSVFQGVTSPYRICDTRAANSTTILKNQCDTGGASPIGASGDISVAVAGYQSPYLAPNETPVPKGATAVVLNVTAVGASTPSYLSVCPGGEAISSCKASSNLNFVTGENIPNLVQVGLPTSGSAAGDIEVYNFSGSVNVVIDVEGYYTTLSGSSPSLSITTTALPGGTVGQSYSATLSATGGTSPYTWSISSGTLPSGLSLASSTGVISGTPSTATAASFGVTVTDSAGKTATASLSITITASSGTAITWSAATNIDGTNGLFSVSCPTTSFCEAVGSGGDALVYNGTSWSAATNIDGTNALISVSCPSSSFCEATDNVGNVFSFNGTTWSSPTNIDGTNGLISVSCSSTSFCVATDNVGNVLSYNGTSWSSPTNIDSTNGLFSVSCPSSSFCVATDNVGNVLSFNGTSWTTPKNIDGTNQLYSLSCPSSSFCVATDNAGNALSFNGTTWSAPQNIDGSYTLESVSCPSTSFCAAVDNAGNVLIGQSSGSSPSLSITTTALPGGTVGQSYSATLSATGGTSPYTWSISSGALPSGLSLASSTGVISGTPSTATAASFGVTVTDSAGKTATASLSITITASSGTAITWSAATNIDATNGLTSVSCPSSSFCMATDTAGNVLSYNGTSWSAATNIDATNGLTSVSCPSSSFCMATDNVGNVFSFNGTSWSAATNIDGTNGLTSVSCPSSSFCMATDTAGKAFTYNSGTWSAPITGGPTSVSCTSSSFCAGVDYSGNGYTYNGSSWSAPTSIDTNTDPSLNTVSCTSSSFCVAGDDNGYVFVYNGTSWTQNTNTGVGYIDGISCISSSFCVAVGSLSSAGAGTVWNGTTFSAATNIDGTNTLTSVSCPSQNFCVATDTAGNVLIGT